MEVENGWHETHTNHLMSIFWVTINPATNHSGLWEQHSLGVGPKERQSQPILVNDAPLPHEVKELSPFSPFLGERGRQPKSSINHNLIHRNLFFSYMHHIQQIIQTISSICVSQRLLPIRPSKLGPG